MRHLPPDRAAASHPLRTATLAVPTAGKARPAGGAGQGPVEVGGARPPAGVVWIVGAGPGDPDLMTVRALRALQAADVILHDALVPGAILALARADAERVPVGRRKGWQTMAPCDCHALMVRHAQAGRMVVRLKGGDPGVFGRGGEEASALRAAGVEVSVVPGITAALGCAATLGMPLTQRGLASAVTLVSAESAADGAEPNWRALAQAGQTLAVYMGLGSAARLQRRLLGAALAPETPVAIVCRATLPDQRVGFGTLATLPALAASNAAQAPAFLLIGEVVRIAAEWREVRGWAEAV